MGTSSRLSYSLARQHTVPAVLAKLSKRHVPIYSILLAFIVGELSFLPFPSWQSLVGLVTSATAIMYAFAPVSLAALRRRDPDRERPYRLPFPTVLAPVGFVCANLIIYWGGVEATWKLFVAIFLGRVLFEISLARTAADERPHIDWRAASWIWPWLVGLTLIGFLGRYGTGSQNILPNWVDLIVVIAFALVIFYVAVNLAMSSEDVHSAVATEEEEIEHDPELALP
jgi:amino acid transporter